MIESYTATDKPQEVQKWQAELAKYPMPPEAAPNQNDAAPTPKENK